MADRGLPSWPKVTIRLYDAHNGEVKIAGRSHPLVAADPREAAIALIAERAGQLGRAVKATAVEPDGTSWPLVIHPDGQVDALDADTTKKKPIWPILVAAGAALALILGTLGYLFVFSGPAAPPKPSVSPTLPSLPPPEIGKDVFDARPFPPGFSSTANWSVDLADGTSPAVSADETKVAIITTNQRIAMLNGAGEVLWQDDVPERTETPVHTTVDGQPVIAAVAGDVLYYWPVNGGLPTKVKVGSDLMVQFAGKSPLAVDDKGAAYVLAGNQFVEVPNKPRRATILFADGRRALMAGYYGPLWWSEPDKELQQVNLQPPPGVTKIDHVLLASQSRVIVLWTKNSADTVPAVHDAATGKLLATCDAVKAGGSVGDWVPDQAGKVAALGTCVIDFTKRRTHTVDGLEPVSTMRTAIFDSSSSPVFVVPGGKPQAIAPGTARPWGIVAGQAVVMHESVMYVLAPKK